MFSVSVLIPAEHDLEDGPSLMYVVSFFCYVFLPCDWSPNKKRSGNWGSHLPPSTRARPLTFHVASLSSLMGHRIEQKLHTYLLLLNSFIAFVLKYTNG